MRKATYPQEQVLFEKSINLKGILATACARVNLFHTEGNKVRFFSTSASMKTGKEGELNAKI